MVQEDASNLGFTVLHISQESDLVGTLCLRAGKGLHPAHNQVFRSIDGGRRAVGGDNQTSPFGRTYIERGCPRPLASASTCRPGATVGISLPQDVVLAIFIGGNRYCCGSGRTGLGPIWVLMSKLSSLQPASASVAMQANANRGTVIRAREHFGNRINRSFHCDADKIFPRPSSP